MKDKPIRKIYIDTNVLINYCTGQKQDVEALSYLFRVRRKEIMFTSSLAIVQTIANLQTKKKARTAFSHEKTAEAVNGLVGKMTVLDLTLGDIDNGSRLSNSDIEDNIHYILSQKQKCDAIITNNVSDFVFFRDIEVLKPEKRLLSLKIK